MKAPTHYKRILGASLILSITVPLIWHSILNYSQNEYYKTLTRELCKAIEPKVQTGATREPLEYAQGMMLRQDFGYTPHVSLIANGIELTPQHKRKVGDVKVNCVFAGIEDVQMSIYYQEASIFNLKYIYLYFISLPIFFGLFLGLRRLLDRFQKQVADLVQDQIRKNLGIGELGSGPKGYIAQLLNLNIPLLSYLKEHIKNLELQVEEHTKKIAEQREAQLLTDVAAQVAHDIVAPITIVQKLLNTPSHNLTENQFIVREELERVTALAQKMLRQYRGETINESKEEVNLATMVSMIAREAEIHGKERIQIKKILPDQSIYTEAVKVDIISALSNIAKNAVEAIQNDDGVVKITLSQISDNEAEISIEDNGCGIPEENLNMIFEKDISFKKNGTGLGLFQAKTAIENLGGRIEIKTQVGRGTTVKIFLPIRFEKLTIPFIIDSTTHLVFVDDEELIHQTWKLIIPSEIPKEQLHFFYSAQSFLDWYNKNSALDTYYFFDQDLSKENSTTGLDLIKHNKLNTRSILVTGRASEEDFRIKCQDLQIRLVDKMKIDQITFKLALEKDINIPDAILIDDSRANRLAWEAQAKLNNMFIKSFESLEDFEGWTNSDLKSIPIFLDYTFNEKVEGPQIAQKLLKDGYARVYFATGLPKEKLIIPDGLSGVIGKELPVTEILKQTTSMEV